MTGWGCSRKSPVPARNAATASGPGRCRSIRTWAGSTPWRRSTVSMHCQGVGASAKDSTVFPTRSRPAEGRARLAREQEEPVAAAHLGEVDHDLPGPVGQLEAPHEPAQADLDVAAEKRVDRRLAEGGRGHRGDVEPGVAEVAERHAGRQGGVERRVERHQDGEALHSSSFTKRSTSRSARLGREGERGAPEGARARAEVEALVLLVAAGQRAAGEIPGQAEDADALLGGDALGAGQVAVDQRPQVRIGHLRGGRRGEAGCASRSGAGSRSPAETTAAGCRAARAAARRAGPHAAPAIRAPRPRRRRPRRA